MIIEKGKTSNGYAKTMNYIKNNVISFGRLALFFYGYNKHNQSDNIYHYVHIFHKLSPPLTEMMA